MTELAPVDVAIVGAGPAGLAAAVALRRCGVARVVILEREEKVFDEWLFRKGALESTMKMRGRLKVSAGEGLREAVLSGLGIAIVSEWLFSPELASGAVESALDDWDLPAQDLWAVFPPGGMVSAKAREFVAFIERCMAAPFDASRALQRSVGFR